MLGDRSGDLGCRRERGMGEVLGCGSEAISGRELPSGDAFSEGSCV